MSLEDRARERIPEVRKAAEQRRQEEEKEKLRNAEKARAWNERERQIREMTLEFVALAQKYGTKLNRFVGEGLSPDTRAWVVRSNQPPTLGMAVTEQGSLFPYTNNGPSGLRKYSGGRSPYVGEVRGMLELAAAAIMSGEPLQP